jgi:hypothetical protein
MKQYKRKHPWHESLHCPSGRVDVPETMMEMQRSMFLKCGIGPITTTTMWLQRCKGLFGGHKYGRQASWADVDSSR